MSDTIPDICVRMIPDGTSDESTSDHLVEASYLDVPSVIGNWIGRTSQTELLETPQIPVA